MDDIESKLEKKISNRIINKLIEALSQLDVENERPSQPAPGPSPFTRARLYPEIYSELYGDMSWGKRQPTGANLHRRDPPSPWGPIPSVSRPRHVPVSILRPSTLDRSLDPSRNVMGRPTTLNQPTSTARLGSKENPIVMDKPTPTVRQENPIVVNKPTSTARLGSEENPIILHKPTIRDKSALITASAAILTAIESATTAATSSETGAALNKPTSLDKSATSNKPTQSNESTSSLNPIPAASAENRTDKTAKPTLRKSVHSAIICDGCSARDFTGIRYKCLQCCDYDLCENCIPLSDHDHIFARIPERMSASAIRQAIHTPNCAKSGMAHAQAHLASCDNCNLSIRGIRYRCSECEDYDLCSECEDKAIHRHHDFIKMRNPFPQSYRVMAVHQSSSSDVKTTKQDEQPNGSESGSSAVANPPTPDDKKKKLKRSREGRYTGFPRVVLNDIYATDPYLSRSPLVRSGESKFLGAHLIGDDEQIVLPPGRHFIKNWKVKNTGTKSWSSRTSLENVRVALGLKPLLENLYVPHLKPGEEGLICVSFIVEDVTTWASLPVTLSSHWMLHHKGIPFGQRLVCQVIVDTESNCSSDAQKSQSNCKGSTPDLLGFSKSKGLTPESNDWLSGIGKDPSPQTNSHPIPLPYIPLTTTNTKSVGTNEAIDLSASSSVNHMKNLRANQYPLLPNYGPFFMTTERNGVKETKDVTQMMKKYHDLLRDSPFLEERASSPEEADDFVILPYPEYSHQPGECSSSSSLEVIPDEAATQSSMEPQPSQIFNEADILSSKEESELTGPSLSKVLNKIPTNPTLIQKSSEQCIVNEKNDASCGDKSKSTKIDSNDDQSKKSEVNYDGSLFDFISANPQEFCGAVSNSNGQFPTNSEPAASAPGISSESIQQNSNIQSSHANPSSLWSNAGQFVENVKRNLLPPSNLVPQDLFRQAPIPSCMVGESFPQETPQTREPVRSSDSPKLRKSMSLLFEMGFWNEELNRELLIKNKFDVTDTVNELLKPRVTENSLPSGVISSQPRTNGPSRTRLGYFDEFD